MESSNRMLIHYPIEEEKGETEHSAMYNPAALETGGDRAEADAEKFQRPLDSGLSKVDSADEEQEGAEGDFYTTVTQKTPKRPVGKHDSQLSIENQMIASD